MRRLPCLARSAGPLLVLALLGLPAASTAGPLRMFGFDASAFGSANSQVALGRGLGVLFSNPALLARQPDQFSGYYLTYKESMFADLMGRPENSDIPLSFYKSDVSQNAGGIPDRPLPTVELPIARADNHPDVWANYIGVGLVQSLDFWWWLAGLKLGVLFLLPSDGMFNAQVGYADEREQYFSNTIHFARFGEWDRTLGALVGLAYSPTIWADWISVGVAVDVALVTDLTTQLYTPDVMNQNYATMGSKLSGTSGMRPIVGLSGRPLDWLALGLTFRERKFTATNAVASLKLWDDHVTDEEATIPRTIEQKHQLVLDYEPLEIAASVGVEFEKVWAQATYTWSHWHNYFDKHRQHPEEAAVFPRTNAGSPAIDDSPYEFGDTHSLRVSAGLRYLEDLALVAGFAWAPSPVPDQVGRTSYVDSDVLGVSLGHHADFSIGDAAFSADVGLQFWYMFPITVHKDPTQIRDEFRDDAVTALEGLPMPEASGLQTNNPGFPGYDAGGWVFSAAVSLTYRFQ